MTKYECENRISDDEIISSLEVIATTRNCSECKIRNCNWGDCNCSQIAANAALDLIKQQRENIERLQSMNRAKLDTIHDLQADTNKLKEQLQAEIEQWKEEANKYQKLWCIAVDDIETAQSEAIKEFAEKLKDIYIKDKRYDRPNAHTLIDWLFANIDNLVKEYEKGR